MTITQKVVENLTKEQCHDMLAFIDDRGRRWRSDLVDLWNTGRDGELSWARRIRNIVGPTPLQRMSRLALVCCMKDVGKL